MGRSRELHFGGFRLNGFRDPLRAVVAVIALRHPFGEAQMPGMNALISLDGGETERVECSLRGWHKFETKVMLPHAFAVVASTLVEHGRSHEAQVMLDVALEASLRQASGNTQIRTRI